MVRPLTKRTKRGELYRRPPAIEAVISAAMRENWPTLQRRLKITDSRSPEHLKSECLVHLLRDASRSGDDRRRDSILRVVLVRCEANLKTKIPDSQPGASDMRQEVLDGFTDLLVRACDDETADEMDFYECRFNLAFAALRRDVVGRERRRMERYVEVPRGDDGDGHPLSEEEGLALLSEAGWTPATQEHSVRLNELKEAVEALPPDEREAFVLCRWFGYKVESKDPDEITAAVRRGCTGRTIRNRLSRAEAKLSRFKEE